MLIDLLQQKNTRVTTDKTLQVQARQSKPKYTLTIEQLKDRFVKINKHKLAAKEYTKIETNRYSVTELSDCLYKSLLRRVSHILLDVKLYHVDSYKINTTLEMHAVKGTTIHKYIRDLLKEDAKKHNITLLSEEYLYDSDTKVGGRFDLFYPDFDLLVEMKTSAYRNVNYNIPGYRRQVYLLIHLINKQYEKQLTKGYIWFPLEDRHVEVEYNETVCQNFLNRVKLLDNVLSECTTNNIVDVLRSKEARELLDKQFCRYCLLESTCRKLLNDRANIDSIDLDYFRVEVK